MNEDQMTKYIYEEEWMNWEKEKDQVIGQRGELSLRKLKQQKYGCCTDMVEAVIVRMEK